jgi:hypothetical protein
VRKAWVVRVESPNGDQHFVIVESAGIDFLLRRVEADAKEITKKEASKPLFIAREE